MAQAKESLKTIDPDSRSSGTKQQERLKSAGVLGRRPHEHQDMRSDVLIELRGFIVRHKMYHLLLTENTHCV